MSALEARKSFLARAPPIASKTKPAEAAIDTAIATQIGDHKPDTRRSERHPPSPIAAGEDIRLSGIVTDMCKPYGLGPPRAITNIGDYWLRWMI
jgi:hypothetical protein